MCCDDDDEMEKLPFLKEVGVNFNFTCVNPKRLITPSAGSSFDIDLHFTTQASSDAAEHNRCTIA